MFYRYLAHSQLARMAEQGDELAFYELYERHANASLRTAFLITLDRGLAEDAVQEAFVQVYRHLRELQEVRADGPWLRRLVVHAAIDRLRRRRWWFVATGLIPQGALDAIDWVSAEPDPARTDLGAALQRLSTRQRAAVVLRYCHDLPDSEVAADLGVPVGTVKSWLHRGLRRLRNAQELRGYATPSTPAASLDAPTPASTGGTQ